MAEVISEENCKKILSNLNSNFLLDSYKVKTFKEESLEGLIGKHFQLYLKYKDGNEMKTLQLFLKTLTKDLLTVYEMYKDLWFFEKEQLFYKTLLPLYEKVGIDVKFAPTCNLCDDEILVCEDLSLSGFDILPKNRTLDLDHSKNCLKVLAKFHMASILYEKHQSNILGFKYTLKNDYETLLKDTYFGNKNYGVKFMEQSIEALKSIADIQFANDPKLELFKNQLNVKKISQNDEDMCCTLLHGDLWSNNFLYKHEDGKIIDTKLIDFQFLRYGPIALDVLLFIDTNTSRKFREENFDKLLDYYYESLKELFNENQLDINDFMTKRKFLIDCKNLAISSKLRATIDRCSTYSPDEVYLEIFCTDETFYDLFFVNRAKHLSEFYLKYPVFRNIVSEDLQELKEMLC